MPEMSTYYYAWIQANQTQARGLIELYSGALVILATYLVLPTVPAVARNHTRIVFHTFVMSIMAALAVLLVGK